MLFDKVWTHLNTFVCSLAHLFAFVTKQMLNLSYIYTAFVHICLRQQIHHYPICLQDKCLICALHKCEQIWQILYLDHICPTFISFQICFFIQCDNKTKTINFFGTSLHRAVTGKMGINRPTQGFSPLCPQPATGKRLKATLEKHVVTKHNVLSSVFIFSTLFDILWHFYTGNRRRKNGKHIITYE